MIRKGEMKHSAIVLHYIFKIIQWFLSIDYLVFSIELVHVSWIWQRRDIVKFKDYDLTLVTQTFFRVI